MNEQTVTTVALIVVIAAVVVAAIVILGPALAGFHLPTGMIR